MLQSFIREYKCIKQKSVVKSESTEAVGHASITVQNKSDTENEQKHRASCDLTQTEVSANAFFFFKIKTDSVVIANVKGKSGMNVNRLVECNPL